MQMNTTKMSLIFSSVVLKMDRKEITPLQNMVLLVCVCVQGAGLMCAGGWSDVCRGLV